MGELLKNFELFVLDPLNFVKVREDYKLGYKSHKLLYDELYPGENIVDMTTIRVRDVILQKDSQAYMGTFIRVDLEYPEPTIFVIGDSVEGIPDKDANSALIKQIRRNISDFFQNEFPEERFGTVDD